MCLSLSCCVQSLTAVVLPARVHNSAVHLSCRAGNDICRAARRAAVLHTQGQQDDRLRHSGLHTSRPPSSRTDIIIQGQNYSQNQSYANACMPTSPSRKAKIASAPVSWFSMKVTAREGHMPSMPGGRPWGSTSRQYSRLATASCRMPAYHCSFSAHPSKLQVQGNHQVGGFQACRAP